MRLAAKVTLEAIEKEIPENARAFTLLKEGPAASEIVKAVEWAAGRGIRHSESIFIVIAVPLTLLLSYFSCRYIEIPGRRVIRDLIGHRRTNISTV